MRTLAAVALISCSLCLAQSPQFEVAVIKPNITVERGMNPHPYIGGRFIAEYVTLRFLIGRASDDLKDFQIQGGPGWINSDRYDVSAKAENNAPAKQLAPMLQSLLADRFKLMVHREMKELPVYVLVPVQGGNKLPATKCPVSRPCGNWNMDMTKLEASGWSMPDLTFWLTTITGRKVIDKTGYTGKFDVHLEWTPDQATPGLFNVGQPPSVTDVSGPSIFVALQEQLGLKLESRRAPVEILVIDHAEKPSEN